MQAEIRINEGQKAKIGEIVRKLNKKGSFITASVIGEVLRISGSESDIAQIKSSLNKSKS